MDQDDHESPAGPLAPQEIDRLMALDAQTRAEWTLEDCARYEQAWGLADAKGWVVFKLDGAPEGRSPWALPLWPRQELAALASRSADEVPRRLDLEALLEALLPEVGERGWQVLVCPVQDQGFSEGAPEFRARLAEAWSELNEEES
ncbi:MAG TPA: DUF2750 domain-containing protein [bacterium]|jgi:hypothetical protein|nr:DUF2750 domain-containing protein [bacterium]